MHWRAKGVLQKLLGNVPGGENAHYLLQRRFGGLRGFTREFDIKMDDWRLMAACVMSRVSSPISTAMPATCAIFRR